MQPLQNELLSLLSHSLFDKETTVPVTAELLQEAQNQAVRSLIMEDYQTLAHSIRVVYGHAQLTNDLRGVPFVTLKGYASAYYYPDPGKRSMGDVDFFVSPENYDDAVDRLIKAGYSPVDQEHVRHEAFRKGNVIYELHSEIKGIPNGRDGIKTNNHAAEQKIRSLLSDLIDTAVTVKTQQGPILIPNDFHHGLIMLLHVAGHMMNDGGIGLRHLCDWAVYANRVNLEQYQNKFESAGLWTFARQLTAVSSRYLGMPVQAWAGEWNADFLEAFIDDILNAGNFSRKDQSRRVALKLSERESLAGSVAALAQKRFPFCAKRPVLLPIGLLCMGFSYLGNRITGKKRWVKPSDISGARRRKALYDQFELFIQS